MKPCLLHHEKLTSRMLGGNAQIQEYKEPPPSLKVSYDGIYWPRGTQKAFDAAYRKWAKRRGVKEPSVSANLIFGVASKEGR